MNNKQPPIGVIPEFVWKELRIKALNEAIIRLIEANTSVPVMWITERNRLVNELTTIE